jgi:hypothetical protein
MQNTARAAFAKRVMDPPEVDTPRNLRTPAALRRITRRTAGKKTAPDGRRMMAMR